MPFLPGDPAKLAADQIQRAVPGQHREKGAQRPGFRVIPARMAPQVHEHILHNVLRGGALSQNAQRRTVHRRRQAVEDLHEGVIVPGRQARRQKRVRPPHTPDRSPAACLRQHPRRRQGMITGSEQRGDGKTR